MKVEIEIKLRLTGELKEIRKTLLRRGFKVRARRSHEFNILFDNRKRGLRKNGKLLRVLRAGPQQVLTFKGPSTPSRYKERWEIETHLRDSEALEAIFAHIGYHPVFHYEKFRTEYAQHSGTGKVLLDETPIGNFLELEGSPAWIDRTARLLGFRRRDYINRSYGYLYLAYCRERRIRPKNMLFRDARSRQNRSI